MKIQNLTTKDCTGYTAEWNFKPFEEVRQQWSRISNGCLCVLFKQNCTLN